MTKSKQSDCSCLPSAEGIGCCRVESILSVDERGQMVLPKEVREKAGIRPGDKMALITWGRENTVSGICLIKADDFAEMVKGALGPMLKEMFR